MSLLLDALKKAAEQKAEKSKQETPRGGPSDETVIDSAAEDISRLEDGADSSLQPSQREYQDQTEIDDSELETRLERTRVEREDGTETGLEVPDSTETDSSLSAQMRTGEDETIIFADGDVSDFLGEPELVNREPQSPEDETDLSQLARGEDETEMSRVTAAGEETDLSQLAGAGEETDLSQLAAGVDETDLSQLAAQAESAAAAAGSARTPALRRRRSCPWP